MIVPAFSEYDILSTTHEAKSLLRVMANSWEQVKMRR